jgi:hypothetical protein
MEAYVENGGSHSWVPIRPEPLSDHTDFGDIPTNNPETYRVFGVMSGYFVDGWHYNGTSKAFRDAYRLNRSGKVLGWNHDNGGGPLVHNAHGLLVQDFYNSDLETRFGDDGMTALVFNYRLEQAFLVRDAFWGAYKCMTDTVGNVMGGAAILGAPTDEEHYAIIRSDCSEDTVDDGDSMYVDAVQHFEFGCMWYRNHEDGVVRIHDGENRPDIDINALLAECGGRALSGNPPGPDCEDECSLGQVGCADSAHALRCGRTDPDACYEWLTLGCAAGLVCSAGSCVEPDDLYCGDGTCSSGESYSTCPEDCASADDECVQSSRRCEDSRRYSLCVHDYDIGANVWWTRGCPDGEECAGGRCRESLDPEPEPEVDPHTVRCSATAHGVDVEIFGPITDRLIYYDGGEPVRIVVGANGCLGWTFPYGASDPRPAADWLGDTAVHRLSLPDCVDGFNLALEDRRGNLHWFDIETSLDPDMWNVEGDCYADDGLMRFGPEPEVPEGPAAAHTITCTASGGQIEMAIVGPITDRLIDSTLSGPPVGIYAGCDNCGGWSLPYGDADPRPWAEWLGETEPHRLLFPPHASGINLALADAAGRLAWFDIETAMTPERWEVTGDCRLEGTSIVQR